jgi:hypothetical protein
MLKRLATTSVLALLLAGTAWSTDGFAAQKPGGNPESPSDDNSGAGNDPPGGAGGSPPGQTTNPNPGKLFEPGPAWLAGFVVAAGDKHGQDAPSGPQGPGQHGSPGPNGNSGP